MPGPLGPEVKHPPAPAAPSRSPKARGALPVPLRSRAAALDLIDAVLRRRRPFDEVFEAHPDLSRLDDRDRAFVHALAASTFRRLGQIDALVGHCLARPLRPRDHVVRDLLRLGVCQLAFLKTPPHAAVDTTVALARWRRQAHHLALVNAVLRRLAAEADALGRQQDAARLDTPDWLWRSWARAYGPEVCRLIAEAHLDEPPLDLTAKKDPRALADRLHAEILPTGTLRLRHHGPVSALAGFAAGEWWVQDAAAALPARLLGDVRGRRVIDLCAAPGGKTAQLAASGARVTAVDKAGERVLRLEDNLRRLGLEAEIVIADASEWRPSRPADAVLVDVPCTATGTIRRHPDIPHIKTAGDVAALARVQRRLLFAALDMVGPGGVVVYCACSLQPEEGPGQIAALLASGAPVMREAIVAGEIGGVRELITAEGDLRTLPFHLAPAGGIDGFYAARLRCR